MATIPYSVGDPNRVYDSLAPHYRVNKAVVGGASEVKKLDRSVMSDGSNLLLPFSPAMTAASYDWYKNLSEFPGFTDQYTQVLVSGLVRKDPALTIEGVDDSEERLDWILNDFTRDGNSLDGFLKMALKEEMTTSRAFIQVNYPASGDRKLAYPTLIYGEQVINWRATDNQLSLLVVKKNVLVDYSEAEISNNAQLVYHQKNVERVYVHRLNEGLYEVREYRHSSEDNVMPKGIVDGRPDDASSPYSGTDWILHAVEENIRIGSERLDFLPLFPLNGEVEPKVPLISHMIERELTLYNLLSRSNYLLYNSAAYTPIFYGDFSEDQATLVEERGIGRMLFLPEGARAEILSSPIEALDSYLNRIQQTVEDMAKLGARIINAELQTHQSGTAVNSARAPQVSQLSSLSGSVSSQLRKVIVLMIRWSYPGETPVVDFKLSPDYEDDVLGVEWARLFGEWYDKGIFPEGYFTRFLRNEGVLRVDDTEPLGPPTSTAQQQLNELVDTTFSS